MSKTSVSPQFPAEISGGDQDTTVEEKSIGKANPEDTAWPEEVQDQILLKSPDLPTLSELQKHRITHLPCLAC